MRFITLKIEQKTTVNILLLLLPHFATIFHFGLCSFVDVGGSKTLALVKVPRPGDSEVTFSVFESSCHLLLPI